jgi:outer membrane receptor for ferrienterochelin and colicins
MRVRYLLAVIVMGAIAAAGARAGGQDSAFTGNAQGPTTRSSKPTTAPTTSNTAFTDDGFADETAGGNSKAGSGSSTAESPELLLFKDMPVVVAAGMRVQTQKEAAASVSVVDANDIELFNYRSLADVLRGQRSFYLYTDGLNWFAGVRGFQRPGEWNARILVLEDGRPTNDIIYGQSHLDMDFVLPMEAIKQIEVVRGPGSALYGTNAVFGVINQVTKDGADINGVQAKIEGGTGDTAHGNFLFGQKFDNGWDVVADFSGYRSQGDNDIIYDGVTDAAHNYGHIGDSDYEGVYSGFFKAKKGDFTFEIDNASRLKDNSDATYLTSWFNPGHMYERRTNATFKIDHDFSDTDSVHVMVYYGHYHYFQTLPFAPAPPTPANLYVTEGQDDWVGEQIHYDWQMTKAFHLLVGAEGTQSLYILQEDHDALNGPLLHVPSSYNSEALFTEAELKATSWLTLTGGVRLDQVQRIGLNVSPRVAAVITPNKQDTFKALYGRAFRDPNLYEFEYASPGANTPNPKLNPEVVDTYELIWERQFKSGWSTTLNTYLWKMSDAMENVVLPDGSVQTRNGPALWAHGVVAEADRRWDNGASFRVYASYSRADSEGDGLTHSPNWIVGASTAISICKNTFLAIEPQIVAPMKSDLGDYTSPSFVTNIVLTSRDFYPGWTIQAGAYNLFSNYARLPRDGPFNQYQPTLNYPQTMYLFSLSHRF